MKLREKLKRIVFFRDDLNPIVSQTTHIILGGIFFWIMGLRAVFIPILKELIDTWIYKGYSKKTGMDLSFWYLGMIIVYLIKIIRS